MSTEDLIYLDHAATTPLAPDVLAVMQPYLLESYGNPSSIHQAGRRALHAIDEARDTVARVLGARPREIIFTGSGSEADNLALHGVAYAQREAGRGNHIITTAIEHHAVLHAADYLHHHGFEVTLLPVDSTGMVSPAALHAALRPDTVLVSVMYANNEIGTVQPLAALGAVCREHGVPFHTDAVQAAGLLPLTVDDLNVDLLTLAAHKFYGPKGVGVLYVRRGTPLQPLTHGGNQERRRRAGTENVAGIVGLATALQHAEARRPTYTLHCAALRDQLIEGALQRIVGAHLNGHPTHRLANNVNLGFADVDAESILLLLDQAGICVSSGSACSSGSLEPSHVLLALGQSPAAASSAVRLSVGRSTTAAAIERTLAVLAASITRLRA